MFEKRKPNRSGASALAIVGVGVAAVKPAEALLINGIDYQYLSPNLYQVSGPDGVELVQAIEVPDAVRDALEVLGTGSGAAGIVTEGAFSPTQSLLLANNLQPPWYTSAANIGAVAGVTTAGLLTGGASLLALSPPSTIIEPPEPPEPVFGYFTGDPNIDALLYPVEDPYSPMAHWEGTGVYDQSTELTYSFATQAMPTTTFGSFQAFGDLEKERTRDIMASIEEMIDIRLTEVTDLGIGTYTADGMSRGHINLAYDTAGFEDDPEGITEGWAIVPYGDDPKSAEDGGDVHLNPHVFRDMYFEDPLGGGATVLIHEIGHALGLAHPFEEPQMDPWLATDLYTIMGETVEWSSGEGGQSPASLMIYDIAALQHLYGANMNTRATDTVYTFDSGTPVFETIWDAGGVDEIVHVGATNAWIDLNPGSLSLVGGMPLTKWVRTVEELTDAPVTIQAVNIVSGASHLSAEVSDDRTEMAIASNAETYWVGGVEFEVIYSDATSENFVLTDLYRNVPHGNVGIAFDVTIENATTDSGNDNIYGNSADNRIDAGAGSDSMFGGEGADVFVFKPGYGDDYVIDFESGIDTVELIGFAPGDYTTTFDGFSTILSFNTGDQLTLYTGGPMFGEFSGDLVYAA